MSLCLKPASLLFTEAVLRNVGRLLPDYNISNSLNDIASARDNVVLSYKLLYDECLPVLLRSVGRYSCLNENKIRGSITGFDTLSLTAILVNITDFWDVTPYSLVDCYYRFEETVCCFFYPVDGDSRFLRKYEPYLRDYTASYPRRQ
jgi:hypothetical protein